MQNINQVGDQFIMKAISVASREVETQILEKSLAKFGWDYKIIICEWKGFGTKIIELYKYLKTLEGHTHFVFTDAYDTCVMGSPDEIKIKDFDGIILSAEKNCWPDVNLIGKYPIVDNDWKFVNSGGIMGSIQTFIKIYESDIPNYDSDDQRWWTKQFLKHPNIHLDSDCEIFQSIAFANQTDFGWQYPNRIYNNITHTFPIFIHGNAKTDMTQVYERIN